MDQVQQFDLKTFIALITLIIMVLGMIIRTFTSDALHKKRTADLEASHEKLRQDFDDWVDGDRPAKGCKAMIDANAKAISDEKTKLSNQIARNIQTEKDIVEIKTDMKYLVDNVKAIRDAVDRDPVGSVR